MLKLDIGRPMVVSGASRLLVLGRHLAQRSVTLVFRCDPVHFNGEYYHLLIDV
jgi:hypothetical protein